jgi:hypothetical protein
MTENPQVDKPGPQALGAKERYAEICNNIRALDENSFRLLAFVPLVSGATILTFFLKGEKGEAFWIPAPLVILVSLAGAVVTFGLYRWEFRNIQICKWLQERADAIEQQWEVNERETQFAIRSLERPPKFKNSEFDGLHTFCGLPITQRTAETIIYMATILAWLALPWAITLSRR